MENIKDRNCNKTIAKNAASLYFRMIVTMCISLYTSRVILSVLGVEDYGIYSVVGGFVTLFSLVSGSLQNAVIRFFTFEVEKANPQKLQLVFSTVFWVMLGLSIFIVLLTETIGLWYMTNRIVIPDNRYFAAYWCFHLSVASFVLSLVATPYQTAILAHEKMSIYAYVSIIDAFLKLSICYAVKFSASDKLIIYAILLYLVGLLDWLIYWIFCKRHFKECSLIISFSANLFQNIFSFAGWNFIGSSAAILRFQGSSLLLNAFGGPVVNAANGIANTVSGVVSNFVNNFTQAFNPQITKRYATGEYEKLMQLIILGSKYSYYLMFLITLPVLLNTRFILELWLGDVPQFTIEFTRWILIYLLVESISRPIITAKNATGDIRNYQIVVGSILLLMLPLSYWGLKIGLPVVFVSISNVITSVCGFFARMIMLKNSFPTWSTQRFFKEVVAKVLYVSVLSCIVPYSTYCLVLNECTNFYITTFLSFVSIIACTYYIGMSISEKAYLHSIVSSFIQKIKK